MPVASACRACPASAPFPACADLVTGLIAPVARLIDELSRLPGVGRKTANRLAYHVLRAPADEARALADALVAVKEQVAYCSICCNITDVGVDPCAICSDARRDPSPAITRCAPGNCGAIRAKARRP